MKLISFNKFRDQVLEQAYRQVRYNVICQVWNQLSQVNDQVNDYVWLSVVLKVKNQLRDQPE